MMRSILLLALISIACAFDYIEYAEEWAPAMCQVSNEKVAGSCAYPSGVTGWTTHGVWPDNNDGTYPSYCTTEQFDENQIKSIEPTLLVTWPDAVTSDQPTDFWASEWSKHGTCCGTVPKYAGQFNYFNQSIILNTQLNLYNALNSKSVNPSYTYWYTQSQITTALNSIFGGVKVIVLCVTDLSNGKEYLSSIRVCVNTDAGNTYRDCSTTTLRRKRSLPDIFANDLPSPAPCQSNNIYYLPLTSNTPATFDYVNYAEQWPPSYCLVSNAKVAGSCGYPANVTGWTTHGVWPDDNNGSYPSNCQISGYVFDPTLIDPILPQLLQTWPDMVTSDTNDDFWTHEWEKHGTCMTSVPMYSGELNYFNASITLNTQINLYNKLASQGIVTSTTAMYTQTQIYTALTNIYGTVVEVMCVKDTSGNEYLSDIRVCIDKNDNTKYIDCPSTSFLLTEQQRYHGAVLANDLPSPNKCSTNSIHYLPL